MNKTEKYLNLINQINSLTDKESDFIANISNITSAIHFTFNFHWTGFYFSNGIELVLGPFQGTVACTRLQYHKGACGTSFSTQKTLNISDVHKFDGHIACSAYSNSEIVVPVFINSKVVAVIDIDSIDFSCFDEFDEKYLQIIAQNISPIFK